MSYLDLAKQVIADLKIPTEAPILDPEEQIGAVLLRSPWYGEVWIALDAGTVPELQAQEQARKERMWKISLPSKLWGVLRLLRFVVRSSGPIQSRSPSNEQT